MKTQHNTTAKKRHYFSQIILSITLCLLHINYTSTAQNCLISDFTSVDPNNKGETLQLPPTHTFQKIIQKEERFPNGGTFNHKNVDFTGYTPINGSSTNGYLTINDETPEVGGAAVLDIRYIGNLWSVTNGVNLDFDNVGGTSRNCSGAVTPWGTIISSEEHDVTNPNFSNDKTGVGYYEFGWQVEINPATKQVLAKHYAMGNFKHENAAILQHNGKTIVYQGVDIENGFLFKYVCFQKDDLSNGDLYVYKGPGQPVLTGSGNWVKIENQSIKDRNCTMELARNAGGTKFGKIEDVEISPDGLVYFAVSDRNRVYYLEDKDPDQTANGAVEFKGTYVGGRSDYTIQLQSGSESVGWYVGNDNMAFDNEGNLWVLFDDGPAINNHIWLVRNGHTQTNPKVEIFATTPKGSESTGITFSPDNRFMFISMQHPSNTNDDTLIDAAGEPVKFDKEISLVIARKEHLGDYSAELGCTDNEACNYSNSAIIDDCSCIYPGDSCSDGIYNEDCDCCPVNVVVNANAPGNTPLQSLYESSQTIHTEVANSSAAGVVVRPNDSVDLKSDTITLNAGFSVEKGGSLNVVIEPCR